MNARGHALKPALYTVPAEGANDVPSLRGGRCICGHRFFPMQRHGCERCGRHGDAIEEALLAGHGTLVASARVKLHASTERRAPFVVVSVKLDQGPVVRTLLAEDTEELLPIGQSMSACMVRVGKTEDGESLVDLRFARSR